MSNKTNNDLFNGCDGTKVENSIQRYKTLIDDVLHMIEYQNLAAKKKHIDIQTCGRIYSSKFENAMIYRNLNDIQAIHLGDFSFYYVGTNETEFTILHLHNSTDGDAYYIFDDENNILVKIMYEYDYYIESYQWFYCDNNNSDDLEDLINEDFEYVFCADAYNEYYDKYVINIKNKIVNMIG